MADDGPTHPIITRKEAQARGLTRFFLGAPCKAGHFEERTTANGQCLACNREAAQRTRGSDPARVARFAAIRRELAARPVDPAIVISRKRAIQEGLAHYFTGVPCVNGHTSIRATRNKRCLACHRDARATIRAEQPEKVKASKAASYLRNRDATLAKVKAYQSANAEQVREKQRHRYQANKQTIAARYKAWAKANRPLLRIHEKRRRDRKRGATGSHTYADVQDIGRLQRWRCANPTCRVSVKAAHHVDHVMPLALGGTDDRSNIQLLCGPCNQSKHARHPIDWARMNGLLL